MSSFEKEMTVFFNGSLKNIKFKVVKGCELVNSPNLIKA
jgi:hypothetical protein